MPAQLPGMLWRVVVTYPEKKRSSYLDPKSKNFADPLRALDFKQRAESAGAKARVYVTETHWVEVGPL